MADVNTVLDQLPEDLRQEVVDFAEFLLAKARTRKADVPNIHSDDSHHAADLAQNEGPWASLLSSLGQFSDDYMAERSQPAQKAREAM